MWKSSDKRYAQDGVETLIIVGASVTLCYAMKKSELSWLVKNTFARIQ